MNKEKRGLIKSDLKRIEDQISIHLSPFIQLIYHLHTNRYYRRLFYHRIGPVMSLFLNWYCPADRYFAISATTRIGGGMRIAHPFSTVINAESIGDNFSCLHCTTLGAKANGRPVVGNNVTLGANVTIIGAVHIGNNVIIGAGSVVVKDLPDDCVVAGNPAHILRMR